ncbi:MAG: hypothetical protein KIT31_13445, partial [Deltaproteobacteria bacterium]|nr:hypothetical protein [Deltaproteobacteria bacterium]
MSDDGDDDDDVTDPHAAPAAAPAEPRPRPSWDKRLDRATWDRLMGRGDRPPPIITEPSFAPEPPPVAVAAEPVEPPPASPVGPPWDRRITRGDWQKLFENASSLPGLEPEAPLAEGSGWMHNSDAFARMAIAEGSSWAQPAAADSGAVPSGVGGPAESSEFPEIRVEAARSVVVDVDVDVSGEHRLPQPPPQLASDLLTTSPAHRGVFATSVPARLPSDFVTTLSISEHEKAGLDDASELGVIDAEVPPDDAGASRPHFISRDKIDALDAGASGAMISDEAMATWQQLEVADLEAVAQELDDRITMQAPKHVLDDGVTTRARNPLDDLATTQALARALDDAATQARPAKRAAR